MRVVAEAASKDARLRVLLARRLSKGASDFEEALRRVKDACFPRISLPARSIELCSGGGHDADHPLGSFPGITKVGTTEAERLLASFAFGAFR